MHGSHLRVETISLCVKRFGDFHCTAHHMPVLYTELYITGEVLTVDSDQAQAKVKYVLI